MASQSCMSVNGNQDYIISEWCSRGTMGKCKSRLSTAWDTHKAWTLSSCGEASIHTRVSWTWRFSSVPDGGSTWWETQRGEVHQVKRWWGPYLHKISCNCIWWEPLAIESLKECTWSYSLAAEMWPVAHPLSNRPHALAPDVCMSASRPGIVQAENQSYGCCGTFPKWFWHIFTAFSKRQRQTPVLPARPL